MFSLTGLQPVVLLHFMPPCGFCNASQTDAYFSAISGILIRGEAQMSTIPFCAGHKFEAKSQLRLVSAGPVSGMRPRLKRVLRRMHRFLCGSLTFAFLLLAQVVRLFARHMNVWSHGHTLTSPPLGARKETHDLSTPVFADIHANAHSSRNRTLGRELLPRKTETSWCIWSP